MAQFTAITRRRLLAWRLTRIPDAAFPWRWVHELLIRVPFLAYSLQFRTRANMTALATTGQKLCRYCWKTYAATRNYFGSQPNGNLRHKCRACVRGAVASWSANNPERVQARNHVRRSRSTAQLGGWATYLRNQQNGNCPLCNKVLGRVQGVIDHLTPLSRGGTDALSNLALVHRQCNFEKHNKTLKEHRAWRHKVGLD